MEEKRNCIEVASTLAIMPMHHDTCYVHWSKFSPDSRSNEILCLCHYAAAGRKIDTYKGRLTSAVVQNSKEEKKGQILQYFHIYNSSIFLPTSNIKPNSNMNLYGFDW